MQEDIYRITGAVADPATGLPVGGLVVKAFDRDFFRQQPLGESVTDAAGHYHITFGRDDFTGPLIRLEHHPDIIIRVYDPEGRLVHSTDGKVVEGAGRDTRIDIALGATTTTGIQKEDPRDEGIAWIGGEPVNLAAAAQLTADDLRGVYAYLRFRTDRLPREEVVLRAFPRLVKGREPWDDCGEGRLESIRVLLKERGEFDLDAELDDFPAGTAVRTFFTANVMVRYTTDAGAHQVNATVPAADAPVTLSNGTVIGTLRANLADLHPDNTAVAPTYVQRVGLIAEHALGRYLAWGFRDPRNGAARMEYRLLAVAGAFGQTSASWSHVEVRPDNSDVQNLHTVAHEFFHQVQYRYNATTTRSGIYGVLREGGARMIEDCLNDVPNRWVDTAALIFTDPTQSMIDFPVGTSTSIRYAAGLFWKYMAEQHSVLSNPADEPAIGIDSYRRVLEASATVLGTDPGLGYTAGALRNARGQMPWYGSFDRFGWYDPAFTQLGSNETTWGNYLAANYLHGTGNPVSDRRFEYMEDEESVTWPGSPIAKLALLQAQVQPADDLVLAQGGVINRAVTGQKAYSARYYRVTPGAPAPRMLRVVFTAGAGMTDPLVQILRIGAGGAVADLHRSDRPSYSKTISMSGLTSVVVIVAARENPGDYTVAFEEVASATDVMVTRWNSAVGREYEIDPRGWSWSWVSPDVMVDTDNDGLADTQVVFGIDNRLKVRIRNRGNAPATGIQVEFWYQKAAPYLTAARWIPVQNTALVTQVVTGETLAPAGAPGSEKWVGVDWAPVDDGTHHPHWCVRARITVAGDPNTDNKMVLSNFGNLVVDDDGDVLQLLRHPDLRHDSRLDVVPRGTGWTLRVGEVFGDAVRDAAGELESHPCVCSPGAVMDAPTGVSFARLRVERAELKPWDGKRTAVPQEGVAYPVPREALPPGVDPASLVTLTHVVDGRAVGGMTYRLLDKA
jgi:hypothetical protein